MRTQMKGRTQGTAAMSARRVSLTLMGMQRTLQDPDATLQSEDVQQIEVGFDEEEGACTESGSRVRDSEQ